MTARVFSIPAGESIVDRLAEGLLAEAGDPLALASTLVLLPTRRGCRALTEAFLRLTEGRPLLLPRMVPIGDVDEDETALFEGAAEIELPPAMPPLKRRLLLASLVLKLGAGRGGEAPSPEQAAVLAGELADLLDQVQIEELDFKALETLVPEDLAEHWKITLDFLKIVTSHWPAILAEQGWMDAALRRNRLIDRRAESWAAHPPRGPVIAAGSTGSMPAVARLLAVVAGLEQGRVVLPGLDRHLDAESWAMLAPSHPQYGLARLLDGLGLEREDIPDWPGARKSPRGRLIAEAMRPDGVSAAWRAGPHDGEALAAMRRGLARIDCPGPREEAGAIALMLREVLEVPGKRAALVTPDRGLGRRVAAELHRYGLEIDDSAGRPLDLTPAGAFLVLVARMAASGFAPAETLAALKHDLALGGLAPGLFAARVRLLERLALRGPRPAPGIAGIKAVVEGLETGAERDLLIGWLNGLGAVAAPLAGLAIAPAAGLRDLLDAHCRLAEALAAGPEADGGKRLWAGPEGEAAADFVAALAGAADGFPPLSGGEYPGLIARLMRDITVRVPYGGHPRLAIWGPLEARLQSLDLLILGGLNEGSWPPEPGADPWLSRPMREAFGLPAPERRIGLSAHDFEQALAAPEVVLTRSVRVDGTPTVPSRWLLRLDAALKAAGAEPGWEGRHWIEWHRALDTPKAVVRPGPPAPRPPLAARPRRLSATAIETWMRDPYAIYARYILRLEPLDPVDADPSAADYGTIVHSILDAFVSRHPTGPLAPEAGAELLAMGEAAFKDLERRPGLVALWWPRFVSVARWFLDHEGGRRAGLAAAATEVKGRIEIQAPGGPFILSAVADRIDRLKDGSLALIDYKTGTVPSVREVKAGFSPQLPLEAAIAAQGGFQGLAPAPVEALLYWRLAGGEIGGEEKSAGTDARGLAEAALEGVTALINAFDDEATAYHARPHPAVAPRYGKYGHLARLNEWAQNEDEE